MTALLVLSIINLVILIGLVVLSVFIYLKLRTIQQGNCVGVPKFNPNAVYVKKMTIPVINYNLDGTATFKPDNTFSLNFSGDVYPNNKWVYNSDTCSLTVSVDPNLLSLLSKYNSSVDTTVKINQQGQLIVNGIVEGLIPIQIALDLSS